MSNNDVDSNPNTPVKSERRPLLKKSRTISDEFRTSTSNFSSSSLSTSQFSPIYRISTSPLPSTNRFSVTGNSIIDDNLLEKNRSVGSTISDRDWYYPSFLGPHSARSRIKIKTVKSTRNNELPPLSTIRVQNRAATVSIDSANKENSIRSSSSSSDLTVSDQKLEEERKLRKTVRFTNSSYHSSSTARFSLKWILKRIRISIKILLMIICVLSVLYSAYLRMIIEQLQGEIINLHRLYRGNDVDVKDNHKYLEFEDDRISYMYFDNANSRTVALYTVLIVLVTPLLLYVFLDYLPYAKILLKRTENNEEEVPLKKRVAYRVDVFFSVYPYAKLIALLFATILLIGCGGLALYAVSDGSLAEALWLTWTFIADAGNHADRVGTGPRIVSVSISSGGMLIFAMMLGLVSDAISEKVDSLRKGKSEVIESSHILILGWSDKLGSLLKQLAIANKSIGGGVVVVLAERDKEEMEMDIAKLEFDFMGTSVICRSGSPLILADLKKVSVSKARAIIVLASDENADQSDARALRVVLSLSGVKEGLSGHVVVEMSDLDNEPLVKLVGGDVIETVVAHDVIGRLMIQCALQPGLAQIWEDILGFENAEFYIKRWPQLDGLCFEDVLISFPDAVPCGVKVAANGGKIVLNPDDDYVLKEGDEILVIAEDDDTYSPGPIPEVLEALLAQGSELWMFNEVPIEERERKLVDGGLDISGLANLTLVHRHGNAVIRRHLESLPLETFDSILILADESLEDSIVHSDSRSLATLLLIRDIQSKRLPYKEAKSSSLRHVGFSHSSWIREMQQASDKSIIISEILDSRTRNLVSVSRISDYVLSNEFVSMALAMVAEDKQINRVLEELFAEEGSEMCIRPAEFYLYDQEELCFYDIMRRGQQRQEIVVGYRLSTADRAVINPQQKLIPRKWSLDDVFVVISGGDQ
ncbi:hypothetical protein MKW92_027098 [Papaver armeniacum]|nr:hypothetical protein MKW92_027098 [Papaver armeniacum]